jgi:hypothetical protein
MDIDVQIHSIEKVDNQVIKGQLGQASFKMEFKPKLSAKGIDLIDIRWTFEMNISKSEYVIHRSKTVFTCSGFVVDASILQDARIELLSELAQISMAHSRVLFIDDNHARTTFIPLMMYRQHLLPDLINQLKAHLN